MASMKVRKCETCGNTIIGYKKYCCDECRAIGKKKVLDAKKAGEPKKRKKPKKFLSINEVLALGKKHGIYGYGNIVAAIEKGEIK